MWRDCAQTCQNYLGDTGNYGDYDGGPGFDDDDDSECFDESEK
jgi:hypothetical protein